jgi:hypothetical protein
MRKDEIEADLPLLEFYFEQVVRRMEKRTTRAARKVSRRFVLETFMETRGVCETARRCRVSDSLVSQLIARACYTARRCAGVWPPRDADDEDH